MAPEVFLTPIPPTPTFTPSPTPTPVIHVVEKGDTLFGIALEYGVTLDALLRVNGLDPDDYLRIGQALIIPMDEPEEVAEGPPVSHMILPTPTPLPLDVAGVALYETPVGGVWCMGEVVNTTDMPVTNLQVRAALVTAEGAPLRSAVALAAADYLPSQARAPFAVLFKEPPDGVDDVHIGLLRAESVGSITAGFVPLEVLRAEGAVSGPQYRVRGEMYNGSGVTVRRISVVVTLYSAEAADVRRKVVGYRHAVLNEGVVLQPDQRRTFDLLLTYRGRHAPASFQVLVWAVRDA